jgi:DNA-binding response OmpR family regulator
MAGSTAFDAVVLDCALPDGRGEDVLIEIRRLRPEVPVIMFSGELGGRQVTDRLLALGALHLCQKPDVPEVVAAVVDACRLRPAAAWGAK